jgi:ribonuclease R
VTFPRARSHRDLTEEGVPLAEERLAEPRHRARGAREGFERRLAAMERDGQVMRNRRGAILSRRTRRAI